MQPKWQPIEFPQSCSAYGESAFQPLLVPANGVVIAGGSRALFIVSVHEIQQLLVEIPAQVHIAGFAVHSGELYVQDGPVLSRWSLTDGNCLSAINLIHPSSRSWSGGRDEPDWSQLHTLDGELRWHQVRLQGARRRVEWLNLLEQCEAENTRAPSPELQRLIGKLSDVVGPNRVRARVELEELSTAAAAVIFSAPVVRTQQVGAKARAIVFVIARDGMTHAFDARLQQKGSKRFDRSVRPSLAMGEWETDAHSDDFAARLYYLKEDGGVRMLDANSLPLNSVGEWPSQGATTLTPGVRPRVEAGMFWGSGAQGSGIFALPADSPGAASRLQLPLPTDWRWLEIYERESLALVSSEMHSQLISFAPGTVVVDRFGGEPKRAAFFTTFLRPEKERPLLVLEVSRESDTGDAGVAYRLVVANTVDQPAPRHPSYPPSPVQIAAGVLEGNPPEAAPKYVRTQPWISREDAYLVARDVSPRQQIQTLMKSNDRFDRDASPELSGIDALHCYPVGSSVTLEQARHAKGVIEDLKDQVRKIKVRLLQVTNTYGRIEGPYPLANHMISVQFDTGQILMYQVDGSGFVELPGWAVCHTVTITPIPMRGARIVVSKCTISRNANNEIVQTNYYG